MTSRNPRWWQLYAIMPLTVGLFLLEPRLAFSTTGHREAQFGIVFVVFGLTKLWLETNRGALIRESVRQTPRTLDPGLFDDEPHREEAAVPALPAAESGRTGGSKREPTPIGRLRLDPPASLN